MNYEDLKKYCTIIDYIVGKETIISECISNEVIADYYTNTAILFKNIHSKGGAMHFPISFSDKVSHDKKLLYQAEFIQSIISKYDYSNVLELGCGMGFNIKFLAKKNPDRKFTGTDLTHNNIKFASRKSNELSNALFLQMDYDEIEKSKEKYDLIFAIETLCHSKNLIKLLNNLSDFLTEKGRIIIFDAYVKQNANTANQPSEKRAYKLLSWGYALKGFQNLDDILTSKAPQFKIDKITEYSENILSNTISFQEGTKKALRFQILLKILLKMRIIPLAFIKQISAGLFGAYFIRKGYLGYYKLELSRKTLPNKT